MSAIDINAVRDRIYQLSHEREGLSEDVSYDVAFHMTDWADDLEALFDFYKDPQSMGDEELSRLLTDVLIHVPNHLAAAAKLFAGAPVKDIFGVGATSDAERGTD